MEIDAMMQQEQQNHHRYQELHCNQEPTDIENHMAIPIVAINIHSGLNLYEAAKEKNVHNFKNVLQRCTEETGRCERDILNTVNESGDMLIHIAATHGSMENVKLIVNKSPSLLTKENPEGETVWHIAAKTGNATLLQALVDIREKFKEHLSYGNNRLNRRSVTWEDLSLRGVNEEGNTALHEALLHRGKEMAEKLVKQDPALSYDPINKENKSALYLAAEAGYRDFLSKMLRNPEVKYERLKGKSLAHAAIMGRHKDVLEFLWQKNVRFITECRDEGMNLLHWAASIGFLEGVQYLIDKKCSFMATQRDENGSLPIHWASMNGHVHVIKELLPLKFSNNQLNKSSQNVLHVAAKSGKHNVVSHILKTPELNYLINQGDRNGNTPLHLASMQSHPKIVSNLTWDERVDLKQVNKEGQTALDVAEYNMDGIGSIQQWLTWHALKAAGARRAPLSKAVNATREGSMQSNNYKNMVKALCFLSIIVAMVSFQAGSTKFACYNNFETHLGTTTTMLRQVKLNLFILCHTVAMYGSVVVVVTLICGKLGDANTMFGALRMAKPLLGMALTMMTLALMPGVYPVTDNLHWLVEASLTTAMALVVSFVLLFFPLCFPISFGYSRLRYITYFPIHLMICAWG